MSKHQDTNHSKGNRIQLFKHTFGLKGKRGPKLPEYSRQEMKTELFRALQDQPLYKGPIASENDRKVKDLLRMIKTPSSFGMTIDYESKEDIIKNIFANASSPTVITILLSQHRDDLIKFFGNTEIENNNKAMQFFIEQLFQYALAHPIDAYNIIYAFIEDASGFFQLKHTNNAIFKKFIQTLNDTILDLERSERHDKELATVKAASFIQIKDMLTSAYSPAIEDETILFIGKHSLKNVLMKNYQAEEFVLSSQLISELLSRVYTTYESSDQQKIIADTFYEVLKDIFAINCNKYQSELNTVQKMIKYVLSKDQSFIKLIQSELIHVCKSERDADILASGKIKEIIFIYGISNYLVQPNDEATNSALAKYIGGLFARQITYKSILDMKAEFGNNPALNLSPQDIGELAQYFEEVVEMVLSSKSHSKASSDETKILQCKVSQKTFDHFIKFIDRLIVEDHPVAQLVEEEHGDIYDGEISFCAPHESPVFEQENSEVGPLGQCIAPRAGDGYYDIVEH